jgi:hypothetical protein
MADWTSVEIAPATRPRPAANHNTVSGKPHEQELPCRKCADLGQDRQHVGTDPLLGNLAISNAIQFVALVTTRFPVG